ncbi:MAG: DUF3572 domain-containing protein [Shimia sp.]
MSRTQRLDGEAAHTRALQVLAWLMGHDALGPVFLGASGARAEDLAAQAADPAFLAAVLDFVLQDDAWVIEAAGALGCAPEGIVAARAALPGQEQVHWT